MKYRHNQTGALHECFPATAVLTANEPGVNWRRLRDRDQLMVIMSAKDTAEKAAFIRFPDEFNQNYTPDTNAEDAPVETVALDPDRTKAERRLANAIHQATEGQWEPTVSQAFDILNAAIGPAPVLPLTPLVEIVTYVGDKPVQTHGGNARYISWTLKVNGVAIRMADERIRWEDSVHPDRLRPPASMLNKMQELERALGVPYITEDHPKRYEISDRLIERVFQPAQLENLHDMQKVLDAMDQALATDDERINDLQMQVVSAVEDLGTAKAQNAELRAVKRQVEHERGTLATAIINSAFTLGITPEARPMSGPQVLMLSAAITELGKKRLSLLQEQEVELLCESEAFHALWAGIRNAAIKAGIARDDVDLGAEQLIMLANDMAEQIIRDREALARKQDGIMVNAPKPLDFANAIKHAFLSGAGLPDNSPIPAGLGGKYLAYTENLQPALNEAWERIMSALDLVRRATDKTNSWCVPQAWMFELARVKIIDKDEYTDFGGPQLSFTPPEVPDGAARNVKALIPLDVARALVQHLRDQIAHRDNVLADMTDAVNTPTGNEVPNAWAVGTPVHKTSGYKFPGEVRAAFLTKAGKLRYVIESWSKDTEGMLHIFSPENLAVTE